MNRQLSADRFPHFPFPSRRVPVFARNGVATCQPPACQAGLQVLQRGGNAVDAAATMTIVEPTANGIGGDAFAMVRNGGGILNRKFHLEAKNTRPVKGDRP